MSTPFTWNEIKQLLMSPSLSEGLRPLIAQADQIKFRLEESIRNKKSLQIMRLQKARLLSSSSLKGVRQDVKRIDDLKSSKVERAKLTNFSNSTVQLNDKEGWAKANLEMGFWVQNNQTITWEKICQLNQILVGGTGHVRQSEVYSADEAFVSVNDIKTALFDFQKLILEKDQQDHPLVFATRLYQRLITIHPFEDGNGRTSRLVADWHLMSHGFPPLCFASPVDTFLAILSKRECPNLVTSAQKVLKALYASERLLIDEID